jgi:hypothetical protein
MSVPISEFMLSRFEELFKSTEVATRGVARAPHRPIRYQIPISRRQPTGRGLVASSTPNVFEAISLLNAAPRAFGPPDATTQRLQLHDLAVVNEEIDLVAIVLDIPLEHGRVRPSSGRARGPGEKNSDRYLTGLRAGSRRLAFVDIPHLTQLSGERSYPVPLEW